MACAGCGKKSSPRSKCPYCGRELKPVSNQPDKFWCPCNGRAVKKKREELPLERSVRRRTNK